MLANLTIRTRLALLLGFVNVLLFAAAGYAWYAIARLNDQLVQTIRVQDMSGDALDDAHAAQLEFRTQVQEWKDMLLRGEDAQLFEKHSKAFAAASDRVKAHLVALNEKAQGLGLPQGIADKIIAEHDELDGKYLDAYRQNTDYHVVDKVVRGIDRPVNKNIDALAKLVRDRVDRLGLDTASAAATEKRLLVIGLAILALLAAAVSSVAGYLTVLSITRRLARATEFARTVAAGNLDAHVETGRNDELGQLLGSMREMNGSLASIVGRVRQAAEKVTTSSSQIAAGNIDLSSRTEQQASSLEETAASIEEMTATVNQNAQNADQANDVASSAALVAKRGGDAVDEVVKMMDGIQASSRKIGDIIGVIDSIAFQTNILALNAAVEAARAGDQGRGFAVVAAEVRSLAQRSAAAAKEIKDLITDSVERVNAGASIADGAGHTMVEVVTSVNRVSQIIGEIASATTEQSAGIAQVNQAVGDLEKATQQNAALVQESTAASESLKQLAREMVEAVSAFRLASRAAAPSASQRAASPSLPAKARAEARPRIDRKPAMALAAVGGAEEWKEF